jgi:hypothetical protein
MPFGSRTDKWIISYGKIITLLARNLLHVTSVSHCFYLPLSGALVADKLDDNVHAAYFDHPPNPPMVTVLLHIFKSITPLLVPEGPPPVANPQDLNVPIVISEPSPNEESFEWHSPNLSRSICPLVQALSPGFNCGLWFMYQSRTNDQGGPECVAAPPK